MGLALEGCFEESEGSEELASTWEPGAAGEAGELASTREPGEAGEAGELASTRATVVPY